MHGKKGTMVSRLVLTASLLGAPAIASFINISIQGSGLVNVPNSQIDNPANGQVIANQQSVGSISTVAHYAMTTSFVAAEPGILRTGVAAFTGDPDPTAFVLQTLRGSFSAAGSDTVFLPNYASHYRGSN